MAETDDGTWDGNEPPLEIIPSGPRRRIVARPRDDRRLSDKGAAKIAAWLEQAWGDQGTRSPRLEFKPDDFES